MRAISRVKRQSIGVAAALRAAARNQEGMRIEWRFSVEDAHRALTHLYPIPEDAT